MTNTDLLDPLTTTQLITIARDILYALETRAAKRSVLLATLDTSAVEPSPYAELFSLLASIDTSHLKMGLAAGTTTSLYDDLLREATAVEGTLSASATSHTKLLAQATSELEPTHPEHEHEHEQQVLLDALYHDVLVMQARALRLVGSFDTHGDPALEHAKDHLRARLTEINEHVTDSQQQE